MGLWGMLSIRLTSSPASQQMAAIPFSRVLPLTVLPLTVSVAPKPSGPTMPQHCARSESFASVQPVTPTIRWLIRLAAGDSEDVYRMAQQALEVLHVVAQLQLPSTASGQALLPLPRAHRQLSSPRCLPHLAQVALTPHAASWGCLMHWRGCHLFQHQPLAGQSS